MLAKKSSSSSSCGAAWGALGLYCTTGSCLASEPATRRQGWGCVGWGWGQPRTCVMPLPPLPWPCRERVQRSSAPRSKQMEHCTCWMERLAPPMAPMNMREAPAPREMGRVASHQEGVWREEGGDLSYPWPESAATDEPAGMGGVHQTRFAAGGAGLIGVVFTPCSTCPCRWDSAHPLVS